MTKHLFRTLVFLFAFSLSLSAYAEKRALLVGVQTYPNATKLRGPVNDLRLMRKFLVEESRSILPQNLTTLEDTKATAAAIWAELNRIKTISKEGDVFIFYFAGHGSQAIKEGDRKPLPFLMPTDYSSNDASTHLYSDDLQKMLSDIKGQKLVIYDACHSGGLLGKSAENPLVAARCYIEPQLTSKGPKEPANIMPPSVKKQIVPTDIPGVVQTQIAAARPEEKAYEVSTKERPEEFHGVFTTSLIKTLREQTQAGKPRKVKETLSAVASGMRQTLANANFPASQTPQVNPSAAEIIFNLKENKVAIDPVVAVGQTYKFEYTAKELIELDINPPADLTFDCQLADSRLTVKSGELVKLDIASSFVGILLLYELRESGPKLLFEDKLQASGKRPGSLFVNDGVAPIALKAFAVRVLPDEAPESFSNRVTQLKQAVEGAKEESAKVFSLVTQSKAGPLKKDATVTELQPIFSTSWSISATPGLIGDVGEVNAGIALKMIESIEDKNSPIGEFLRSFRENTQINELAFINSLQNPASYPAKHIESLINFIGSNPKFPSHLMLSQYPIPKELKKPKSALDRFKVLNIIFPGLIKFDPATSGGKP